jgi:BirA family biotin operon repressor/biotin-[acetyl-CoA-carboxylase] ligase
MQANFSKTTLTVLKILKHAQKVKLYDLATLLEQSIEATEHALHTLIQNGIPIEYQEHQAWINPSWQPLKPIIAPHLFDAMQVFDILDSTNQYLKQPQFRGQRHVCVAEMQTQGRGRFGRQWVSPFGLNLYLSLRCPFDRPLSALSGLSIVVGLAVCKALNNMNIQIKWPNDLWFQQKKLGGILIEILETSAIKTELIVGLGLNINGIPKYPATGTYPWTSLAEILDQTQDRQSIMQTILESLHETLNRFNQEGLQAFLNDWRERDALWGRDLEIIQGQKKFRGQGQGINRMGELIIKDSNQVLHTFDGGEVTIKL